MPSRASEPLGHGVNQRRRGQHPHLDRSHGEIAQHGLQLRRHHLGGHGMDRGYPLAVLDGEGRDHREAIGPQEGGHLQILLQPRPGARVGASDN